VSAPKDPAKYQQWKENLSRSHRGRIFTDATREKLSRIAKELGFGKWSKGTTHSAETKRKMSEALRGSRNPMFGRPSWNSGRLGVQIGRRGPESNFWKGGLTGINRIIRNSREYRLWRAAVFRRDGYACVLCGAKSKSGQTVLLEADHIKPFCDYPHLRFAVDNGRTLCKPCHRTTPTFGKNQKLTTKTNGEL
jgi:hypothetical protein